MAPYTDQDVNSFLEFIPMPPEEARQWLDRYDGLEVALDKYMEFGGIMPAQTQNQQMGRDWDENLFSTMDRDVYGPDNKPSSFAIQGPDQTGMQRPNSRVDNWVSHNNLSEDDQIKMAMERSTQDTGTTELPTSFRAVPDNTYKSSHQMAPYTGMAFNMNETVPAAPDQRQRANDGSPAFIRPNLDPSSQLASLLTILHNIPLARETLLGRDAANIDYGGDPEWWNGKDIVSNDEYASEPIAEAFTETQRLIAALDATNRAYVSIDLLEGMTKQWRSSDVTPSDFFKSWMEGAGTSLNQSALSLVRKRFQSELVLPTEEDDSPSESEDFWALQMNFTVVPRRNDETLMSILSRLFIEHRSRSGDYPYFESLPDILILQCIPPYKDKFGVKIPAKFNGRRFLEDPSEKFITILDGYVDLERTKATLENQKKELSFAEGPGYSKIPYDSLLDACMKHLKLTPSDLVTRDDTKDGKGEDLMDLEDGDSKSQEHSPDEQSLKAKLEHRLKLRGELGAKKDAIAQSIRDLDQELLNANERLNQYQAQFDFEDAEDSEETEYRLCGVGVGYDVFYVLARPRNNDDLLITDKEPQWWHIQFTHGNPCSYSCTKTHEYVARKAAFDSTEDVLLVYSNPEGLRQEQRDLPPSLQTFVEVDNENFKLELQGREEAAGQDQEMPTITAFDTTQVQNQQQQRQRSPTPTGWGGDTWGGENDRPQLPPRTAQATGPISLGADSTSLPSEQNSKNGSQEGTGSKKRGARWASGIRNALSRSKSRERANAQIAQAVDLLTDDLEQTKGAVVMAPDGKLKVPGSQSQASSKSQHEDKKAKR